MSRFPIPGAFVADFLAALSTSVSRALPAIKSSIWTSVSVLRNRDTRRSTSAALSCSFTVLDPQTVLEFGYQRFDLVYHPSSTVARNVTQYQWHAFLGRVTEKRLVLPQMPIEYWESE